MYLHVFTYIENFLLKAYLMVVILFVLSHFNIATNIKQKESRYILKDTTYICFPKKCVVLRFAKDTNCV